MVGFTVIDDLGGLLPTDQDVDGLEIKVNDAICGEMSESVDHVEENKYFAPKGDGFVPYHGEIVKLLALNVFHHQTIVGVLL